MCRGEVVGLFINVHHVGLPLDEMTPQAGIVVHVVVPVEAHVRRDQLIAGGVARFQHLAIITFSPIARHNCAKLDIRKLGDLFHLALVRGHYKRLGNVKHAHHFTCL